MPDKLSKLRTRIRTLGGSPELVEQAGPADPAPAASVVSVNLATPASPVVTPPPPSNDDFAFAEALPEDYQDPAAPGEEIFRSISPPTLSLFDGHPLVRVRDHFSQSLPSRTIRRIIKKNRRHVIKIDHCLLDELDGKLETLFSLYILLAPPLLVDWLN